MNFVQWEKMYSPNKSATSAIKISTQSKQSPNRRKFAQSGHPGQTEDAVAASDRRGKKSVEKNKGGVFFRRRSHI
jgi:hypothetical protein